MKKEHGDWFAPLRGGLFIDEDKPGKHFKKMGRAIWLYGYLLVCADWRTGKVPRTYKKIVEDTGIPRSTAERMMNILRVNKYIETTRRSRGLDITITKWRQINAKKNHLKVVPEEACDTSNY